MDGDQNEDVRDDELLEEAGSEASDASLSATRIEHYRRLIADGSYEQRLENLADHLMSMGVDSFLLDS